MFSPVTIDISDLISNSQPDSDGYKVTGRSLTSIVSSQISSDLILAEIKPELFTLVLDSLTTKTIPVEIELDVEFVSQMNLKNKVTTTPDLVEITGPTIVLNDINTLKTKVSITNKLSTDFQQKIELLHPEKTTIVPDQVTINIEVEKYTEKEIKIPVEIINKPEGVNLKLFPSEIKLLFKVGLSRFDKIKESDFGVSVDYNSIVADVNSLVVTIYKQPEFVQNIRINPERVEFLIETD
jgi:YbbR domain-containing protein